MAFIVLALATAYSFYVIDQQRTERTKVFCQYVHQEKVDDRNDALKGYLELSQFSQFFAGDPKILQRAAAKKLKRDLHQKYGNNRIPIYCPQHKWPEDQRKWPPELRTKP